MSDAIYLAQLLGLFMIIMGIGLSANQNAFKKMMKELKSSHISLYISGMVELIFGLYIILHIHNFNTLHESIITMIGVGAIIESIYYIIFPKTIKFFAKKSMKLTKHLFPIGVLAIFIGVYLTLVGFGFTV